MGNLFCPRSKSMDENFDERTTIKVSGVSKFLKDQITKIFQSEKNEAGINGDVKRLHVCPYGKDYVLVEFGGNIEGSMPKSSRKFEANGTSLKAEPYVQVITDSGSDNTAFVTRIWDINNGNQAAGLLADVEPLFLAPFSETRVKLEPEYIDKIQREKGIQNMLAESEVKLDDGGYLSGTWNSIYRIGQSFIRRYIYGTNQNANADEHGKSDPPVIVATSVGDEQNGKGKEPVDEIKPETVLVQTLLFRYIITYHHHVFQALEDVSEEIRMKKESKNEKLLTILPRADVRSTFDAALNKFIDFYQKQSEKMHTANKSVRSPVDMTVIKTIGSEFSLIIDVSEESKTKSSVSIYGEKSNVQKALTQLTTKFGQLNDVSSNPVTTTTNVLPSTRFSCTLSNNVNVFVYQGDLVEEKVDVIVNPANERLEHFGGAAEAIAKAGGKTIQSESNEIMRKRRKCLVAGDVEPTTAGKLPCKFIVHAVGPRRTEHTRDSAEKALFAAVMNSLKTASTNDAHSISIPAISSGVFDIPVDFCAKILFNAVEAFAKDKRSVKGLHEVRFVNIDKSTTDVFVQEMRKRYSANVKKETRLGISPPSAGNPSKKTTHNDAERQTAVLNPLMSKATTPGNDQSTKTDPKVDSKGDKCTICLCDFTNKKTLHKCGHSFCTGCIDEAFKHQKKCPICSQVYGPLIGNQPPGKMTDIAQRTRLAGFPDCGSIRITYTFDSGVQGKNHPNPGQRYHGTTRYAYLPDNREGQKVLKLLRKAFDQKLTFTIGRSSTTGANNVITWNDIHHKTNMTGGATGYGYPDPDYLKRVQDELAAKGITE